MKNGNLIFNFFGFGRVQFVGEKNFKQTIPKVRVKEGRDGDEKIRITKEIATIALRRTTKFIYFDSC